MKKLIQREFKVAFHKGVQPLWVRIGKYVVIIALVVVYRDSPLFWWVVAVVLIGAFSLHGFFSYKTKGWTQSYVRGLFRWDYDRMAPKE